MKYTLEEIREFIKESNAIEDVWTDEAIDESLEAWGYISEEVETLGLMDILIIHKVIMKNLDPEIAGKFRSELGIDVQVGGRPCPRYYEVGNKLSCWITSVNSKKIPIWDEDMIEEMHIQFENIHPFADGNGRSGRLIYAWMREKMGLPIHIIYEKDKQDYYEWFRR